MTDRERITEILKAYTKKNNISASVVILEEYAEELVRQGVKLPVMCKDCKYYKETGIGEFDKPLGICKVHKIISDDEPIDVDEDDFCSYGELKEREGK